MDIENLPTIDYIKHHSTEDLLRVKKTLASIKRHPMGCRDSIRELEDIIDETIRERQGRLAHERL